MESIATSGLSCRGFVCEETSILAISSMGVARGNIIHREPAESGNYLVTIQTSVRSSNPASAVCARGIHASTRAVGCYVVTKAIPRDSTRCERTCPKIDVVFWSHRVGANDVPVAEPTSVPNCLDRCQDAP